MIADALHKKFHCIKVISEDHIDLIGSHSLLNICLYLKNHHNFEQLIDISGLDYLDYGRADWATSSTPNEGYSRAVSSRSHQKITKLQPPSRFAVVYHFLSITYNYRFRIKCFLPDTELNVPSVTAIWPAANWYERELFDLFGITVTNHPDLRRILTDYDFAGHPLRKDFPVSGYNEVKFDPEQQQVVYEDLKLAPRVLVPKVIRED